MLFFNGTYRLFFCSCSFLLVTRVGINPYKLELGLSSNLWIQIDQTVAFALYFAAEFVQFPAA